MKGEKMNPKAPVFYIRIEGDEGTEPRYEVTRDAYPRSGFERMKEARAEMKQSRDKWRDRAMSLERERSLEAIEKDFLKMRCERLEGVNADNRNQREKWKERYKRLKSEFN